MCWKKKGGCGAKFPDGAFDLADLKSVENPDLADTYNTVLKMAKKPSKQEFRQTVIVCGIGMFVLGISAIIFGILPGIFLGMMSAWSGGLVSEAIVDALTMMGVKP